MIRGTTPTVAFDVDADLTTAQVIYVTMAQMGRGVETVGADLRPGDA